MPGHAEIYRAIADVPAGKVTTYGRIAETVGLMRGARQVGYALAALRGDSDDVPWHRVVNAEGRISQRADAGSGELQRRLLEAEGVQFDDSGRINLARFLWLPPD